MTHQYMERKIDELEKRIEALEQDPCNTCGYEEGSIYCKEHCPHEAKVEQASQTVNCDACLYDCPQWAKNIAKSNGCTGYISSAQSKTGHWEVQPSNKEMGERDFIWWKCSECGQIIYSETEKDRREFHAFCGRCGAKMLY